MSNAIVIEQQFVNDDYYTSDAYDELMSAIVRLCVVDIATVYVSRFMVTGEMPKHPSEIHAGGVNFNTAVSALTKNKEILSHYETLKTEDFFRFARLRAIQSVENKFKGKIIDSDFYNYLHNKCISVDLSLDESLKIVTISIRKQFSSIKQWAKDYEVSDLLAYKKSYFERIRSELKSVVNSQFVKAENNKNNKENK